MRPDINAVLNRLLVTLYRSFPLYLETTGSAVIMPEEAPIKQTVARIVVDYRRYVQQLVELIQDRRAQPDFGDFPLVFTDTHDLSFEYLLTELLYYERQDLAVAEECVRKLAGHAAAAARAADKGGAKGAALAKPVSRGRPTAQIADADYAHRFFGIWLAPQTSAPALRNALLGPSAS